MPGPVPKRSDQRRRRNKPAAGDLQLTRLKVEAPVRLPALPKDWHPEARAWYRSLKDSGQAQFFQASDWHTAKFCARLISDQLQRMDAGQSPRAMMIQQITSLMGDLLATEASRRRVRIELTNDACVAEPSDGEVAIMDAYRARFSS